MNNDDQVRRHIPVTNDYRLQRQLPLPWGEAIRLFFRDNKVGIFKKVSARYLPALLTAAGFADDAAPFIGLLDEPLTFGFLAWCLYRINKYRKTGN
ncbi:MAG: hypothetical protein ABIR37_00175 [Candidatus Saccharimonadales bacterium]